MTQQTGGPAPAFDPRCAGFPPGPGGVPPDQAAASPAPDEAAGSLAPPAPDEWTVAVADEAVVAPAPTEWPAAPGALPVAAAAVSAGVAAGPAPAPAAAPVQSAWPAATPAPDAWEIAPPPASVAAAPSPGASLIPPAPTKVLREAVGQRILGAAPSEPTPSAPSAGSGPKLSEQEVLPLAEADDEAPRPWWRRRVFVASIAIALVGAIATGVFVWRQKATAPLTEVTHLTVLNLGPTYQLNWNGPDVAYQVVATNRHGDDPHDASLYIRGGKQAMIPTTTPGLGASTCFIVRSQTAAARYDITTTKTGLEDQGAQMVCVADIKKSS